VKILNDIEEFSEFEIIEFFNFLKEKLLGLFQNPLFKLENP
jgi:hypothetical protein